MLLGQPHRFYFMRYDKHNVLVHEPHPQSLAALVLLTKKLAPRPISYKTWLRYRKWFLRQHLKKHKTLMCFYCGCGPLKSQSDVDKDLATLDHVKPLSKGGERFHSSNLVVACYTCNSRKKDKDVNEFTGGLT
jgi:5-methylcytosine-specific restriction endonuclease McrA